MSLEQVSNTALIVAFLLYIISAFLFVIAITGKKWSDRDPKEHTLRWSKLAFSVTIVGFVSQIIYFITRWIYSGHIPNANMFEFMTLLSMMIIVGFIIIYLIYRSAGIGVFALPVAFIVQAYAMVFPWEAEPLIPALQDNWLKIHVTTAALGEAFFAVGFATGLMYLIRTVNFTGTSKKDRRATRGIEFTIFAILVVVGFIGSVFLFNALDYQAEFSKEVIVPAEESELEIEQVNTEEVKYTLPPIVKPYKSEITSMDSYFGIQKPLMEAPFWMKGVNAGRKLNTVVWALLTGTLLYCLLRLILRKPIGAKIQPILSDLDPEDLDEISYRSIAIGFPIFTLGALIFAMIWAHIAWERFWGWDPKEVWALIVWLFYSVYLHLRLSRGWQGSKSSWLSVIGFLIVMFTLVGVNLVIAGLHSYAGV
ncbi:cytochrome c biogenesis protein CcsA [Chengkuizengella axinellae]|uniref:Cytochrome c biogenesis protein CcsA n=1 Tax=Chengkuizengella axinellae TaxID=3064388 RepID=A0ABT9IWY6_9BACL|nr:cytochrome c biogenesis protein CcsA [Chengkuizengella sp. 2205SS18-9]MDP5273763.1 cytochrome c biogenesis protein CcsA [Chengkuizengella sp. 2205SS18-9]